MANEDQQAVSEILFPQPTEEQCQRRSRRLPNRGKQCINKPLVNCQILRIERIGITQRGNTPYIVYHTEYGRCCTFISRQYFWQSLLNLCGIKNQGIKRITAYGIRESSITVLEEKTRYSFPAAEMRAFLARQNQMALERLTVDIVEEKILVSNPVSQQVHEVTSQGCNCNDRIGNPCICKHRIAAYLYLRGLGWGCLQDYFRLGRGNG
ncbi:MAG: hypothetical protein N3E45_00845 [Oscillatoriaceae bacterium SKW80]|nr:hypothetical protein [Oscillatoriaceae bacterium SKYG93]MCX8119376.1 hypothetical protein [Oscillatoriaceae bacterium SKW80]MDW8454843.1 hypothetical protein [Oscillatoriaceae cyanobacterium SKYGB_i_bin93]HIK28378.1 hypothetical protein [Oscillatoriaceae cyanobacterium M7585_C2015_266]